MNSLFVKVRLTLPEEQHDWLVSWFDSPALMGAEQTEETLILWFDKQQLPAESVNEFIAERLERFGLSSAVYTVETEQSVDWYELWRKTLKPVHIGRHALIIPFDDTRDAQCELVTSETAPLVIVIEPKMSFGTGHHATTQMCAELLIDTVRSGERWIDLGTGTGILAIIAAKCGAEHVHGIDNDSIAIEEAKLNAARNGCCQKIEYHIADVLNVHLPTSDGVVANLYSSILEQMSSSIATSLRAGGYAILSGILIEQEPSVLCAYQEKGFILERRLEQGQWVALLLRRTT